MLSNKKYIFLIVEKKRYIKILGKIKKKKLTYIYIESQINLSNIVN